MCLVDDLTKQSLSPENILRYIDDYSIYSYYIGEELEINARYSSPLREGDNNPSFSLFFGKDNRKNKIYFKDHATTYKGDVFDYVRIIMSKGKPEMVSFTQVLKQIDSDFQLGLYTDEGNMEHISPLKLITKPKIKERYSIKVTSSKNPSLKFLNYWRDKYDIILSTLQYYNVTEVVALHYISKLDSHKFCIYPKSLCIAYQIGGKYKIYFPFETKQKKFQNDLPETWVEGYLQLKYEKDFIIITKAMKEVIFFREHFDWDTIAGKSENTMIPKHIMLKLFKAYKKVYIWLDSDEAGVKAQAKYLEKYPELIPVKYPSYVDQKDPTDRYEALKRMSMEKMAINEIKNLIDGNVINRRNDQSGST